MASITGWTRLEPRPRSADFSVALEARVRDPLWMLARQWQVGEFKGDDAGSLVAARLEMNVTTVNRYRARPDEPVQAYDVRELPLEAIVEREPIPPPAQVDLRSAAEAGLYFMRLLREKNVEDRYRGEYVAKYPLAPLSDTDVETRRFLSVVSGRAPDGAALARDLRPVLEGDPPSLPAEPAIDPGDVSEVLATAQVWLDWFDGRFLLPAAGHAWVSNKLEYQFEVSAPDGEAELVLRAEEYYTGDLDWYDFDLKGESSLGGPAGPNTQRTIVQSVIPTAIDFDGMPAPRWWEFEDGRVDFGRVDAAPEDLARLLLLEFALVYGNDWLMIPVTLDVGSLCRIRSLVVTDTFGERIVVPAASSPTDASAPWGLYYLARAGRPLNSLTTPDEQVFFLPPTLASSLESTPVEEVLLIRDEMANMAWGIERKVQGPAGRAVDRFEAYQEKQRQLEGTTVPPDPDAAATYRLGSTVPDHWIPLVPVHVGDDQRAIALQRGAMLDPATGTGILARGRFLTPGTRLLLDDEEVPRIGVQLTRTYQHARWTNGASLLWMGRRKRAGRGEGSSGLRFDTV